jgi:hypothetical protein
MSKPNGGPAFPVISQQREAFDSDVVSPGWDFYSVGGMSIRDYFAIRATEEDLKMYFPSEYNFFRSGSERTAARYAFADAMVAEREKA